MQIKTESTYVIRLYLSGPIEVAKQALRRECLREGLCVTIEPTTFIYTGGEEAGFVVGLLNYPRFPSKPEALRARAEAVMLLLLRATFQHSALMVTPEYSRWITLREQPQEASAALPSEPQGRIPAGRPNEQNARSDE